MNWDLKDEDKGIDISITFFNNPILSCSSLTIILNLLRGLIKNLIKMLIYVYIHTHTTFLSVDIGCFHILAIVSNTGKTDWLNIGKGVCQNCILSPCLLSLYAEYIIQNARLEEVQASIKITGRNKNKLRYADDTTLMAESKEELENLLMKVKEESEKVGLKLNIQKTKIMTSCPITSWQIDGQTMETVTDFVFLCSKITTDGDCSHEIKRHLILGRKAMTNLDSILKSRDITLPIKVHLVKAMVFPVVMYCCELDHKQS